MRFEAPANSLLLHLIVILGFFPALSCTTTIASTPEELAQELIAQGGIGSVEIRFEVETEWTVIPYKDEPGYLQTLALIRAHPNKISAREYRQGDWALLVGSQWFYWARGRLLGEELKDKLWEYSPYSFYPYYLGEIKPREITPEILRIIQDRAAREKDPPIPRHPGFYDALWNSEVDPTTFDRTGFIYYFGNRARVHREIIPLIEGIIKEMEAEIKNNPTLREFTNSLELLSGWNYRTIAGTLTRSMHSYGLALDFEPYSYRGSETYWRWARRRKADWWNIKEEDRWAIPQVIIDAFEARGFIWGGKWLFYDTMHFEYRPEIQIYNQLLSESE
jgi:hypothetical protein